MTNIKIFDNKNLSLGAKIILENELYHSKEWLLYFQMNMIYSNIDKNKHHVIAILYNNNITIGCLFLKCNFKRNDKKHKYRHFFLQCFIKEQYRNKGYGKKLIHDVIKLLTIEYKITKIDYRQGILGSLYFYDKTFAELKLS